MTSPLTNAQHRAGLLPGDRLAGFDFEAHNAEVRETWAAFDAGKPYRTPIILGTNTRYFLFNKGANPTGFEFKNYIEDPDLMFDAQLQFQRWSRYNLLQDQELGLPEKWSVAIDFQNFGEAAFFGCPIEYINGEVPDTMPIYGEDPERVMENGIPDPFSGIMERGLRYYEHFKKRAARETFLGRPIEVAPPFTLWADGVFTVACNLFRPDVVCMMALEEPDRLRTLLDFISTATIKRMQAWRKMTESPTMFSSADDSIALISTELYRELVLPYHKQFCDTLGGSAPRGIHLCGDSTRHFVTIRDELNVQAFDTGFPVDFGKLRRELGPKVRVNGGPHVGLLLSSGAEGVRAEVQRIMASGILEGGLFVLRDGNNLAPHTPLENTEAMYHAGREFSFRR